MLIQIAKQHPLHHKSIAVVGGGIGGLAFANALLYKDKAYGTEMEGPVLDRVTIYDQASHFSPTAGAGFGLSPNGQICLSSIGIEGYKDMLHPLDRAIRINHEGTMIRQESNVFEQLRNRVGFGIAGCLRADMVHLLAEPFTNKNTQQQQQPPPQPQPMVDNDSYRRHKLLYSHKLIKINPIHDKVELEFENGVRDLVDLVVGADGIHSPVAKMMNIDPSDPIHAGSNIIYGKIENPDQIDFESPLLHGKVLNGAILNGPGTGEFLIFHVGPPERKVRVWVTTYASSSPPPPPAWSSSYHHQDEEWNEGGDTSSSSSSSSDGVKETLARYPLQHMIHELAHHTTPNNLLHFGLFYRQHKKTWFHHESNRVVLLGDACHATLPFVGQGANQAIEDAIVLADALFESRTTPQLDGFREPFQRYYDQRFDRTKRVVGMGNMLNKLYHSENYFLKWALDLFLTSLTGGGAMFKQLENEIVQHCPVKDYDKYRPK